MHTTCFSRFIKFLQNEFEKEIFFHETYINNFVNYCILNHLFDIKMFFSRRNRFNKINLSILNKINLLR